MDSRKAEQGSKGTCEKVQLVDLKTNKDPAKKASVLLCCSSVISSFSFLRKTTHAIWGAKELVLVRHL